MSFSANAMNESKAIFQLKGGLYPLTALQLLGANLSVFEQQLDAKIQQAPNFFHNAPIVIDLQKIQPSDAFIDFNQLVNILLKQKLIPVGVKNGALSLQKAAAGAGLAILQDNSREPERPEESTKFSNNNQTATTVIESEIRGSHTKIVTEPVRSGQQIYVRGGDLIVLAAASQGSELLADGNIHIYGPLRGRALAGVTGDENTRIFCQSLEAELISIAGQYKISEDIDQAMWRTAVEVSLEAGRLHIRPL